MLDFLVKEAETKDVGRGIARLHPGDMEGLGVKTGDILKLEGKLMGFAEQMLEPRLMRGFTLKKQNVRALKRRLLNQ